MSEESSGGGEKTLEPTQKKLDDARKKGNVAKSADISVTASYLGLLLAMAISGRDIVEGAGAVLSAFFSRTDTLSTQLLSASGRHVFAQLASELALAVSPLFLFPMVLVFVSIIAQRALIFAPSKLAPKLSRISPISMAKNKFGPTGLFEFAKSTVKLVIVSSIVAVFISWKKEEVIGLSYATAPQVSAVMVEYIVLFLWMIFAISLAISAVDYLWQSFDHQRKLMMSLQEVKDEAKDQDGDPHAKQQRRQRGYDIATNRMLADVPEANVIVVNPQHYAVALKWSGGNDAAPICVAKGVDEIAARIREIAAESGVPIHRDPPTARAIHANVEIGREILPEHYRAVAAAIRFAETIRAKMGTR